MIQLTDKRDLGLCSRAQYALVNNTTFPSGFISPPTDMIIVGDKLLPANTVLQRVRDQIR
jgi:hypothetical protein